MNQLRLSDEELAALAADLESDRIERKQSLAGDAPTKIREAICAFANDLPRHGLDRPGVVLVGLNDPGHELAAANRLEPNSELASSARVVGHAKKARTRIRLVQPQCSLGNLECEMAPSIPPHSTPTRGQASATTHAAHAALLAVHTRLPW